MRIQRDSGHTSMLWGDVPYMCAWLFLALGLMQQSKLLLTASVIHAFAGEYTVGWCDLSMRSH